MRFRGTNRKFNALDKYAEQKPQENNDFGTRVSLFIRVLRSGL